MKKLSLSILLVLGVLVFTNHLPGYFAFNYKGYQKENNLNPKVFQEVEGFLKNGDVRGAYLWFYNRTADILGKLRVIKTSVDSTAFPELKKFWRLNQVILEAELFGQQKAEIFFEI